MKSILVTGGLGFIGSHTCISLIKYGYRMIIIDSNINSSIKSIQRIKNILNNHNYINTNKDILFEKGDVRNAEFLDYVFLKAQKNNYSINGVIHFAGLKAVEESVNNPLMYWDFNVNGSIQLLKVMNKFSCRTIVFSSSATIYDSKVINPIAENSNILPSNPYGDTKATIENILNGVFKSSKESWRVANLRYFNPIGAHPSGLIGEDPLEKPNNIFPLICKVARGYYEKICIYGDDWPTVDGTGIRDYVHVMDLAQAHCLALDYLLINKPKIINLNIGTGIGTSVLQLIKTFELVNKCNVPYEICKKRPGDVAISIADNKLATSILKWKPIRSLEDMCKDGWKWQLNN